MEKRLVNIILLFLFIGIFACMGVYAETIDNCGTGTPGVFIYASTSQTTGCFTCGDPDFVCPTDYGVNCGAITDIDCGAGPVPGPVCDTDDICDPNEDFTCPACLYASCGEYLNEAGCTADTYNVGDYLGATYYNIEGCDIEAGVECLWDTDECLEEETFTAMNPGDDVCSAVAAELGKCKYSSARTGDCSAGAESIQVTYDGTGNDPVCPVRPSKTFPCPGAIKFPFFTAINFIISALAIAMIYAFSSLWKRDLGEKKAK